MFFIYNTLIKTTDLTRMSSGVKPGAGRPFNARVAPNPLDWIFMSSWYRNIWPI